MTLSIDTLRDYLWYRFGIVPERVWLSTQLRAELYLTDEEIKAIVGYLMKSAGITFSVDTIHQLTDVFDLLVYVLLRSVEETALTYQLNEFNWPFGDQLL